MDTDEIRKRERDERATYCEIGTTGRSAASDNELLIPEATVQRYRAFVEGARPLFPLEQMIAWAAPRDGQRILEICGHTGENGAILARLGATVDSVDIAEALVELVKQRAKVNGIENRLRPAVMSVHAMGFADNSFDAVFGKAALHHLDLKAARDEIHRVLKPGGVGIFAEPVVLCSLLRVLRSYVPIRVDKESPGERQLNQQDLDEFYGPFSSSQFAYFRAFGRLERIIPSSARPLAMLDSNFFRMFPSLSALAGVCVMRVTKGY